MLTQIRSRNATREFLWLLAILLCTGANVWFVHTLYDGTASPDSIQAFVLNFFVAAGVMLGLTLLWWLCATTEWSFLTWLRTALEQNAAVSALVFCVLAWGSTAFFYFYNSTIYSYSGTYSLSCILTLPSLFTCLMYLLPPVNIKEVILPGSGFVYGTLRVLLILAVSVFGVYCFWDNFIR